MNNRTQKILNYLKSKRIGMESRGGEYIAVAIETAVKDGIGFNKQGDLGKIIAKVATAYEISPAKVRLNACNALERSNIRLTMNLTQFLRVAVKAVSL